MPEDVAEVTEPGPSDEVEGIRIEFSNPTRVFVLKFSQWVQ